MPDETLRVVGFGIRTVRHWWMDDRFPIFHPLRIRHLDIPIEELNPIKKEE